MQILSIRGGTRSSRSPGGRRRRLEAAALAGSLVAFSAAGLATSAAASQVGPGAGRPALPSVLLVGSYNGIPGQYATIQAAVDAAAPGDWILVGPGDYHESPTQEVGVWVWTPDIHLRGMNRNSVILDGTKPGAPVPCDSAPQWQNYGPATPQLGPGISPDVQHHMPGRAPAASPAGSPAGREGIYDYAESGVTVENMTVCNFVSGSGPSTGNQVWFDGGHFDRPTIHDLLGAYGVSYVTAFNNTVVDATAPTYGIFVSNTTGPGIISNDYASGFNDAGYYIGGCDACGSTMDQDVSEYNVLGYSGTNSGGNLVIRRSIFAFDKSGIAPNSENNDDAIPPQTGACPAGVTSPLGNGICMLIEQNMVYANNNPDVVGGRAGGTASEVGAGILMGGSQHVAVLGNTVSGNGSWGIIDTDYPNIETPPPPSNCQGGVYPFAGNNGICYFYSYGNEVKGNGVYNNGFFGNPTNSDLAEATLGHTPGNCWIGNYGPYGAAPTSDPANLQATQGTCFATTTGDIDGKLGVEEACNFQLLGTCSNGKEPGVVNYIRFLLKDGLGANITPLNGLDNLPAYYPQMTDPLAPTPGPQQSMPDPCAGVPANAWCPATTGTPPSAPRVSTLSSSGGFAGVSWYAPTSPGSGTVTHYTVSAWPGDVSVSVQAPRTYAILGGLTAGTPYFFTVTAWNSAGLSATSQPSGFDTINYGNVFAGSNGRTVGLNSAVTGGPPPPTEAPVAGIALGPEGRGLVEALTDGNVVVTGTAVDYGRTPPLAPSKHAVGVASTPDGKGYWIAGADGGVFTFGDARFYGSLGSTHQVSPIVGITATPDGRGYWLVDARGGVFAFGDAHFRGSGYNMPLAGKVIGLAPGAEDTGYWLATDTGAVYTFGPLGFYGSASDPGHTFTGFASSPDGLGYWLLAEPGDVFSYGTAFHYPQRDPLPAAGVWQFMAQQPVQAR